ncbi:thioredoxin family protein [uncultured Erythrobacter sp.]|uniref:protein-disulfide reductase DsbD family protein n=1 Tax=uncultured Erythrobacter sp. TaxID=263913 RepID=UPI0026255EAA|nr:thioredoxin family protein [uncultured Erythrobacter sp.]
MIEARMFPRLKVLLFAWVIAFAALAGASAFAQDTEEPREARFGDENIAVQLLADGLPQPGEEWMLALKFTPSAPEWHGYWSNPGDAGQGMRLELDLPEGWEMGEALYPVPERLLIGDLMNHIYEGQYAVLVPVRVPEDAVIEGLPDIGGYVDYLACTDRVCVPQDAALTIGMGGDFARWQAEVAPLLDASATFEVASRNLRLAIPLPEAVALAEPHVFVTNERLVDYAAVQTFRRDGDMLIVEIPLTQYDADDPSAVGGILSFGDEAGVEFGALPGDVPTGGSMIAGPVSMANTPPLWTLILGALAGGLILNIMPCVFPILSLKALSLARAGESEAKARAEGIAYTAGVVLACVGLGALMLALREAGEQVGWAFQLQSPSVVIILLVLATIITANFGGLFELPSLSFTQSGEPAGAFATGLLAAFAATPCTGPFMAAALGAALLLPAPLALLLFAMLGLGLALPFLLIGFVPALRGLLPKPGAWMERFRRIMAIPMGLTALALIWLTAQLGGRGFAMFALVMLLGIVIALGVVGRLQRAGKMAWPAFGLVAAPFLIFGAFALPSSYAAQTSDLSESLLAPREFSRDALAEARASGQPVFLWFTADWCVTCKVNESVAIEREATAQAFEDAGVIAMVGDWTVRDEEITEFLTQQGAAGVPLYLWYEPGAEAEQLPQVLTPDMLTERAKAER